MDKTKPNYHIYLLRKSPLVDKEKKPQTIALVVLCVAGIA